MRNVAERASNYALMSALYERQIGDISTAQGHLNEAKKLDPNNVDYSVQEGTHVCRAR
jgi:cytochrome c-type biogenesis protein CcmH/NrfG